MRRTFVSVGVLTTAALALAGCASTSVPPEAEPSVLSHVHALGFDQDDDGILIATHVGVYRIDMAGPKFGEPTGPVGGYDFDVMGLTTSGALSYASGHPGPEASATFSGPNLGLLASSDYADSWEVVSLAGEADFHDLSASASDPYRVYGLEGTSLRRSDNGGSSWTDVATLEARDIQALADNADVVYATTPEGLMLSTDAGESFAIVPGAPALLLVAEGVSGDRLIGVDVEGFVWSRTDDDNATWARAGRTEGLPQALKVMPSSGRLIVADDRGISISDDLGDTWTTVWAITN